MATEKIQKILQTSKIPVVIAQKGKNEWLQAILMTSWRLILLMHHALGMLQKIIKLFIALGFVIHPSKSPVHSYSKHWIPRICDSSNKHDGLFI